jgi:hypothetical protein
MYLLINRKRVPAEIATIGKGLMKIVSLEQMPLE